MAKVLVYKNGRPQFEEVPEIVVSKEYLERELTEEEKKELDNELDNALIFCTSKNEETGEVLLSPLLGEESIIIRCKEDVEVIKQTLMNYFYVEESTEEKAVTEIMKILTQEGMTYRNAKRILERVQLIVMESSKNFLDNSNAKEVLETPNRYQETHSVGFEHKGGIEWKRI